MTSIGDYTKGILVLLGNRENSDDFCRDLRMRIFILATSLESNKNSGEKGLLLGSKFRSLDCLPFYWGVILGWGETKVNCYLVDFQTSR